MDFIITKFDGIKFSTELNNMVNCTNTEFLRYLKGIYTNKERFINRYITVLKEKVSELLNTEYLKEHEIFTNFLNFLVENYEDANTFTFKESFEIQNREFQGLVFSSININEMILELGAKRYKTDGTMVKHRKYTHDGEYIGDEEYHNIYEIWEINGNKLGINDNLYAVKCWCTSTNKEHWLWIEDTYKDDPLEAIASTFRVHPNVLPHIKCLKRQGDLLLVEMNEDVKPEGEPIPLKKEQYFSLLVAQS